MSSKKPKCHASDRLITALLVQVPGATVDMLSMQLFDTVDEFLQRTSAWQIAEDIQLVEGQTEYDLAIPSGSRFVRVMALSHNGRPVPNGPLGYVVGQPSSIAIWKSPDLAMCEQPMRVISALALDPGCGGKACCDWGVPEYMWQMFHSCWLDGTLGKMFTMPSKPWSNKLQAGYHHKRFRNRMANAKHEATQGSVYAQPNWRFPQGGFVG